MDLYVGVRAEVLVYTSIQALRLESLRGGSISTPSKLESTDTEPDATALPASSKRVEVNYWTVNFRAVIGCAAQYTGDTTTVKMVKHQCSWISMPYVGCKRSRETGF
jgi:hypothetical protein